MRSSVDVLAYFRTPGAAAARGAVAQELLGSRRAIHLAHVNIAVGVDCDHMRPMELAGLAAAAAECG